MPKMSQVATTWLGFDKMCFFIAFWFQVVVLFFE